MFRRGDDLLGSGYESEVESARLKIRVKELERSLQKWDSRLTNVEEHHRNTIDANERRILKLEYKVRMMKAKLKLSNAKIRNLESLLQTGHRSYNGYVDSQQETEVSEAEGTELDMTALQTDQDDSFYNYNGDSGENRKDLEESVKDVGEIVKDLGEIAKDSAEGTKDSGESAKENVFHETDLVSRKRKRSRRKSSRGSQESLINETTSQLDDIPAVHQEKNGNEDEVYNVDDYEAYQDENYYQYEGGDELTASNSSSPAVGNGEFFDYFDDSMETEDDYNEDLTFEADETTADADRLEGQCLDYLSEDDDIFFAPYECPICPKAFMEMDNLQNHIQRRHQPASPSKAEEPESPFQCQTCNKSFKKQKHLHKHIKSHASDSPSKHMGTEKSQETKELSEEPETIPDKELSEEPETIPDKENTPDEKEPTTQCSSCLKNFPALYRLKLHNDGSKAFYCRGCNATFSCRDGLRIHVMTCDKYGGFRCDKCGIVLGEEKSLKRHVARAHGPKTAAAKKPVGKKCPRCPKICTSANSYREHVKGCVQACTQCKETFATTSNLNKHIQRMHNDDPVRKTKSGRKRLPTKKPKSPPAEVKSPPKETKSSTTQVKKPSPTRSPRRTPQKVSVALSTLNEIPECPTCEKTFASQSSLQRHLLTHTREYVCLICKQETSSWSEFENHIESTHPESKGIEKRLPPSSRGRPSIKKLICSQCFGEFSTKEQLLKHFASVHAWWKPHKCDKCEKTFMSTELLKKHEGLHD